MPLWPLWIEMLAVPAPRFAYVARRAAVLHRPGAFAGARMCSTGAAAEPLFSVLQVGLARAAEREQRKRASLEKEASAATKAEGLGRWGTLVTSNLYRIPADATSAVVEDWEQGGKEVTLTFDAKIGSPRLEAEKAFIAARKLRRGSAVVADLLEESRRTTASLGEWQARPEPGCTQCAHGLHRRASEDQSRANHGQLAWGALCRQEPALGAAQLRRPEHRCTVCAAGLEQSATDPYALGTLQAQLVKRAKKLSLKAAELH